MFRSNEIKLVMAGLVPAIPIHEAPWRLVHRDARDTSAFTRVCDALLPAHDLNEYERDLL
jgi:hypothetical protein